MECADNLPPYTGSSDLIEYIDPIGIAPSREADYRRIAEGMVNLYGITLCDEADAALIGQFAHAYTQRPRTMTRWPEDFDKIEHLNFLRAYVQHNALDYRQLPAKFHNMFPASGATHEQLQQAIFDVTKEEMRDAIRSLTSRHSRSTMDEAAAVPAQPGGTTIAGSTFDFPTCVPANAQAFKTRCDRRASGHWSQAASSSAARAARYQRQKCGDREYSLRTDASATARAPLADGLAPSRPPAARAGHAFACCILEAKYSSGGSLALYQDRTRYMRNVRTAAALIKGPGSGAARQIFIRAKQGQYATAVANSTTQLTAYMGVIADPDIPYWRLVYICSNDAARDYFATLIRRMVVARAVSSACKSEMRRTSEHWRI